MKKFLRRALRREGYRILTAASGDEALELLAMHTVQVLVAEQCMGHMSGVELLRRVHVIAPETVGMILSGRSNQEILKKFVNEGAIYKTMSEPWDDGQLRSDIRDAFVHAEMLMKSKGPSGH